MSLTTEARATGASPAVPNTQATDGREPFVSTSQQMSASRIGGHLDVARVRTRGMIALLVVSITGRLAS